MTGVSGVRTGRREAVAAQGRRARPLHPRGNAAPPPILELLVPQQEDMRVP